MFNKARFTHKQQLPPDGASKQNIKLQTVCRLTRDPSQRCQLNLQLIKHN